MFSLSLVFTSLYISLASIQFSAFLFLGMLCAYVYDDIFKGTRQQTTNIITGSGRVPLLVVVVSPSPFIDARSTWIRLFSSSSQPRERWISVAEFIFICRLRWVRLGLNGAKKIAAVALVIVCVAMFCWTSSAIHCRHVCRQHTAHDDDIVHTQHARKRSWEFFAEIFNSRRYDNCSTFYLCDAFFTCLKWNFSFKKSILLLALPPLAGKKGGVLLGMHEIFLRRAV